MAGASIDITINDKLVIQNFTMLERKMGNTTPIMAAIGTGLVASTTRRFVSQTGGGGRLAFFIGGRMVRPTSVTIEARPYLGVSSEDQVMIGDTVQGFVRRYLR